MQPGPTALAVTKGLTKHALFSMKNPNKVRALLFSFTGNPANFHRADGTGYDFIAGKVLELDRLNPQIAARLAGAYRNWRTMEPGRQALAHSALATILAQQPLSRDTTEIVSKILA